RSRPDPGQGDPAQCAATITGISPGHHGRTHRRGRIAELSRARHPAPDTELGRNDLRRQGQPGGRTAPGFRTRRGHLLHSFRAEPGRRSPARPIRSHDARLTERPKMLRTSLFRSIAVGCTALVLAACGGTGAGTGTGPGGDPVPGGTAQIIQISEPRTLDPVALGNQWVINAMLGNALYGTLMVNNPESGKIDYTMATGFATHDG